jgi:hypothetical protein
MENIVCVSNDFVCVRACVCVEGGRTRKKNSLSSDQRKLALTALSLTG